MSEKERSDRKDDRPEPGNGADSSRRRLLKSGALLVPVVLTLRARPAWAQTDYMLTAYTYGENAGLCRNPKYNPSANPGSRSGTEFVPCPNSD